MLMCKDLAMIASNYIDGELTGRRALSVKMHLLMCRHCRTFIGNLRASNRLIQGHSSAQIDEEYLRRLNEQITDALDARRNGDPRSD